MALLRILAYAAAVSLLAAADATAQVLTRLGIQARALDSSQLAVAAEYHVTGTEGRSPLVHRAILFAGQRIGDIRLTSEGRDVGYEARTGDRSMELRVDASGITGGRYSVAYRVISPRNPRFPIFVPISFTVPPDSVLDIAVRPVPGVTIVGDSFPRLRAQADAFVATLVNVPSFLLIRIRPVDQGWYASDWLTVGTITNLSMFAVVLAASAYRWRLRALRKAERASGV